MYKYPFIVSIFMGMSACVSMTPGVQKQAGGNFTVECSPLEEQVCQRKAEQQCMPNNIKILKTEVVKKYSNSSVISENAFGLNDTDLGTFQTPKHRVDVLVATVRCDI